jgi:hypothetical protein
MLALTDAALARICIGATRIDPRRRGRWLREIAAKLDPSPEARSPSRDARRQAKARALHKKGIHIHHLPLRDICVEGLITQMVTTGRLTEAEAFDDQRVDAELARLLEEQGERWVR